MASENSAKYFENSYFKLQYVVADSIVLSAPTYTAQLCSRRPEFDSPLEVLCWSRPPLSTQYFLVISPLSCLNDKGIKSSKI